MELQETRQKLEEMRIKLKKMYTRNGWVRILSVIVMFLCVVWAGLWIGVIMNTRADTDKTVGFIMLGIDVLLIGSVIFFWVRRNDRIEKTESEVRFLERLLQTQTEDRSKRDAEAEDALKRKAEERIAAWKTEHMPGRHEEEPE